MKKIKILFIVVLTFVLNNINCVNGEYAKNVDTKISYTVYFFDPIITSNTNESLFTGYIKTIQNGVVINQSFTSSNFVTITGLNLGNTTFEATINGYSKVVWSISTIIPNGFTFDKASVINYSNRIPIINNSNTHISGIVQYEGDLSNSIRENIPNATNFMSLTIQLDSAFFKKYLNGFITTGFVSSITSFDYPQANNIVYTAGLASGTPTGSYEIFTPAFIEGTKYKLKIFDLNLTQNSASGGASFLNFKSTNSDFEISGVKKISDNNYEIELILNEKKVVNIYYGKGVI